jgi:flagellar hook protein FlgE
MSDALLSGVSGLQAHQTMLDVAGNNLANVDTYGYKSSRVTFAELLSQTLREATQPTASTGGTNPQQVGAGVTIASIDRNMTQGTLISTGQPLDMAIDGAGYFTLNDGQRNVYTRVGAFAVDANYFLVDPGTGDRVQRIGSEGVTEGFQNPSSTAIRIPYDVALPAKATSSVNFTGNLSADNTANPTTCLLSSGTQYSEGNATAASDTKIMDLDQASGMTAGSIIRITGTTRDGTAVALNYPITATSTMGNLATAITAVFPGSTATISNGEIRLSDNEAGYSKTDLQLSYSGTGTMELPRYFAVLQAGGAETRNTNMEIYDTQGTAHQMSVAFVRTDTPNTWDAVLMSATGDVSLPNRRIEGISFNRDGSFGGVGGASDVFSMKDATGSTQDLTLDLGTIGTFDGLSQFGGPSTVSESSQDGYQAGYLSSLSVNHDGVLVGMFTNGVRENIAALQLATFQNSAGLQSAGGSFFLPSANSGNPLPTKAQSGGAGAVTGGSLEKSNVDMASEFVSLIQAQNGYQANARTISVANQMLQSLTTLMR